MNMVCLSLLRTCECSSRGVLFTQNNIEACFLSMQKRFIAKHFLPKWKRERRQKYLVTPQFDYQKVAELENKTPGERRALMKMYGVVSPHQTPISINLTESGGQIFNENIPLEEGNAVSRKVKNSADYLRSDRKANKTLRLNIPDFRDSAFLEEAQTIYEEAHTLLTKNFPQGPYSEYRKSQDDWWRLHEIVTETGWETMTNNLDNKTLTWRMVESIEPARIVRRASQDIPHGSFVQITVRFHTKQVVALYDRFGRLITGNPTEPRDVLDYVVYERRVTDSYGRWRIHARLNPPVKRQEINEINNSYVVSTENSQQNMDKMDRTK